MNEFEQLHPSLQYHVVNTLGWVRGPGLELLASLCRDCCPTHMLQLRGARAEEGSGMPPVAFWAMPHEPPPLCRVLHLRSAAAPPAEAAQVGDAGGARRSAAEMRALLWTAWAHSAAAASSPHGVGPRSDGAWAQAWAGGEAAVTAMVAEALTSAPPLCAPLHLLALQPLPGTRLAPRDAPRALNGALVALASDCEAGESAAVMGLALVRSVDAQGLYLLTPLPLTSACAASRLLLGRLQLPPALLQTAALCSPFLTPLALAQDGSGGGAMRSRNNILRGSGD